MRRAASRFLVLAVLSLAVCTSLPAVHGTPVMVTVQTQSAEHIQTITAAQSAQNAQRQLLGAIEATQSHIVDVADPYLITYVQSAPTLSLLEDIVFDNSSEVWSFTYETMALDASVRGQINRYYRVLYFTQAGHDVGSSDSANSCLQVGTDYATCLQRLRTDYLVLEDPALGSDNTAHDRLDTSAWDTCSEDYEAHQTFVVTVSSFRFVVDGESAPVLDLVRGGTYTFDQSAPSNANHPLEFKDGAGALYALGVTRTGTPGTDGAQTVLALAESAPDGLRYYCVEHGDGMGATVRVAPATTCPGATGITATLESHVFSATQTLRLRIPHAVIRAELARRRNSTLADSPAFAEVGTQSTLDFGIGMMFLPRPDANTAATPPNNMLIFDMFTILENTFDQIAIMKKTSYSIATHVAFWTAAVQGHPLIRVVTIEYLLDTGHLLKDVKVAINNGSMAADGSMVPISPADCAEMQALLDGLPSARCIAQKPLCQPSLFVIGSGPTVQTWATVIFPIPPWHADAEFQFNTLLFSNLSTANEGRGMPALSTLNFFSSHAPRVACEASETVAFDATVHVRAELYRGHMLASEEVAGTFTIFNTSSLSSAEALVTLVLRPDDSAEALAYFQKYTDEQLRLDELFMSHGQLSYTFPADIDNTVQGAGGGRTTLVLDDALDAGCPLQSAAAPEVDDCVTTKDWDLEGQLARLGSTVYYVHRVDVAGQSEAADLAWLADNIFGHADPATPAAFRSATLSTPFATAAVQARKQYAAIYWIWPVFAWPNTAPIGLVDRTVVSLAWSIAP